MRRNMRIQFFQLLELTDPSGIEIAPGCKCVAKPTIPRSETVIWNTGPDWDRDIANSARTARRVAALLRGFVGALPRLVVVSCVGGVARRYARPLLSERGLLIFETVHPSSRAQGHPGSAHIADIWTAAYRALR